MHERTLDFWFSIGSTYSYLSVMRIDQIAADRGFAVRWRPFSVRQLMREMDNIPFANKPVKSAYMWRDVERRATAYGLVARVPVPYPLKELDLANRVAIVAARDGWCPAYVRATYRRWFEDHLEPGLEPNLSASIADAGRDPAAVVAEASGDAVGAAYRAATDAARELGIFGSPNFVVGRELFWGDDRLDDAIAWLGRARPPSNGRRPGSDD